MVEGVTYLRISEVTRIILWIKMLFLTCSLDSLVECLKLCKCDSRIFRLKDLLESNHVCWCTSSLRCSRTCHKIHGTVAVNFVCLRRRLMQEQKGSFSQSRDHKQSSGKDGWVQSTTYNLEEEDKMSRGFFSLQSRRDFFERALTS